MAGMIQKDSSYGAGFTGWAASGHQAWANTGLGADVGGGLQQGMTGFFNDRGAGQRALGPVAGSQASRRVWSGPVGTGTPASRSDFAAGATRFLRAGVVAPAMLAIAGVMGSAGTAAALEIPKFDPRVEVYTVGDRTRADFDKGIVREATDVDGDKTYVVVYDSISESDRDFSRLERHERYNPNGSSVIRTNQAGMLIQRDWKARGFDIGDGNIVVVDTNDMSYAPGAQVGITPGANWDALGFNAEQFDFTGFVTGAFGPQYRANNREGATAAVVDAIDRKIDGYKDIFNGKIEKAQEALQNSYADKNAQAYRDLSQTVARAIQAQQKEDYGSYAGLGKDLDDQTSVLASANTVAKQAEDRRVSEQQRLVREFEGAISRAQAVLNHTHITENDKLDLLRSHLDRVGELSNKPVPDHEKIRSTLDSKENGSFLGELLRLESLAAGRVQMEQRAKMHQRFVAGGVMAVIALLGWLGVLYSRRRKRLDSEVSAYEQDIVDAETQLANIVWKGEERLETILGGMTQASRAYMHNRSGTGQGFSHFANQSFEDVFKAIDSKSSTGKKFVEYLKLKDELRDGLLLFKGHISRVRQMSWISLGKVKAELDKLKVDGDLSADALGEDLASSRQAVASAVNPVAFWTDLEAKFDAFKTVKDELDAAVTVITQSHANQDFPADEFNGLQAQLAENEITREWLKEHPLSIGVEKKWAEWDVLRQSDPVEYQKTIAAEKLRQETIKNNIQELIHQVKRVQEAKARLEQSANIDYTKTEITDDKYDPRIAETEALQSFGELKAALQAPRSLFINVDQDALADVIENFVKLADTATDKYEEVLQRKTVLQEIMENVAVHVIKFETELAEKNALFTAAQGAAATLSVNHDAHSRVKVLSEIQQASEDLAKAENFLLEAKSALQDNNHVLAEDRAKQALGHIRDAQIDIDDILREASVLEKNRTDYAAYYQSLSGIRAQKITQMAAFAPYNDENLLKKGDLLKQEMPASSESHGQAANWAEMLARLKQVNELWDRGVKTAENLKTVDRVDEKIEGLENHLERVKAQVREVDLDHNDQAMQQLHREIQEAGDAVQQADAARDQAVALKGQAGKDAEARDFADKAATLQAQAQKEIQDVENEIERLERLRQDYLRKREEAQTARGQYLSKMRSQAGHFYSEAYFSDADRLFEHHANPALAREVNYALLITQLDEVNRAWDSAVDRAVRRYRDHVEEQERIAAERRRREREERERREREERERREAEERRREERAAEQRRSEERRSEARSNHGGGGNRGGGSNLGGGGNRGGGANF